MKIASLQIPGILKDKHKMTIALNITSSKDLQKLGIIGLKMKLPCVNTILTNHRDDINGAALKVVDDWSLKYEDPQKAYEELLKALRKCKFSALSAEIQELPDSSDDSD